MPLLFLNDEFNIPQDLLREFPCRCPEGVHHVGGIELIDVLEVILFEIVGGIEAAARHQGVCDTVGEGFLEGDAEVEVVEIFEVAVLCSVSNLAGVVLIIFTGKLFCNVVE